MNSDMSGATMTEKKKTSSFFNFISLATFIEYAESKLGQSVTSRLVLVLKFSKIIDNGAYKYYNFLLGGIYDGSGRIDWYFPDLARVKGINFSEKRGEFLLRTFENNPFYIFKIKPLATDASMENFYYAFKTSRVAEADLPAVEQNITERATLAEQGSITVDETFKFSLSK